jgi:hypothetical protein
MLRLTVTVFRCTLAVSKTDSRHALPTWNRDPVLDSMAAAEDAARTGANSRACAVSDGRCLTTPGGGVDR